MKRFLLCLVLNFPAGGFGGEGENLSLRMVEDFCLPGSWGICEQVNANGRIAFSPQDSSGNPSRLTLDIGWHGNPAEGAFSIRPQKPLVVRRPLREMQILVHGGDPDRFWVAVFSDAEGAPHRVKLGASGSGKWEWLRAEIPADWPQPLIFEGLTVQSPLGLPISRARWKIAGVRFGVFDEPALELPRTVSTDPFW